MVGQASPRSGQSPQQKQIALKNGNQAAPKPGSGSSASPSSSKGGSGRSAETPTSRARSSKSACTPEKSTVAKGGKRGQAAKPCPAKPGDVKKRPARVITELDLRPPPPNMYITFLDQMAPEAKAKALECMAKGLPFTLSPIKPQPPQPPPPPSSAAPGAAQPGAAAAKAAPPTPSPKKRPFGSGTGTPLKQPRRLRLTEFDRNGLGVLMLEEGAGGAEGAGGDVTKEALLAKDHLLLRADIVARAFELCNQMVQLSSVWSSDPVDLSSELWELFLQPAAERAVGHADGRVFDGALAELLGVVLFTVRQDAWLRQPRAHLEEWELRGFFERMASAWGKVLAQSDQVLGLAPAEGKEGGYRPRLLALLRTWQDQANRVLEEEGFDGSKDKKLVVSIVEP